MATPKDILKKWIETFNKADAEKISELYAVDAINHQVMFEPVKGRDNIRRMFVEAFAGATMVCNPENIFCDGDWAILEWKDPQGLRGCGFFQVEDEKIQFQRGYWDLESFKKLHGK